MKVINFLGVQWIAGDLNRTFRNTCSNEELHLTQQQVRGVLKLLDLLSLSETLEQNSPSLLHLLMEASQAGFLCGKSYGLSHKENQASQAKQADSPPRQDLLSQEKEFQHQHETFSETEQTLSLNASKLRSFDNKSTDNLDVKIRCGVCHTPVFLDSFLEKYSIDQLKNKLQARDNP